MLNIVNNVDVLFEMTEPLCVTHHSHKTGLDGHSSIRLIVLGMKIAT